MSKKDSTLKTICKVCGNKIVIVKEKGKYVSLDVFKEGDENSNALHKCKGSRKKL